MIEFSSTELEVLESLGQKELVIKTLQKLESCKEEQKPKIKSELLKTLKKVLSGQIREWQNNLKTQNIEEQKLGLIYQVSSSTQCAILDQLLNKFKLGVEHYRPQSIGLSGGVSANPALRLKIEQIAQKNQIPVFIPHPKLTGDNALMIALAGIAQDYKSP